jgi:hypothetical protein
LFNSVIKTEREFSRGNNKIPPNVKNNFKYEYYPEDEYENTFSTKGLFGLEKIMAYVFVFDYNDKDSFEEVLFYSHEITQIEINKGVETKTLKFFIGNKFDFPIYYENDNLNLFENVLEVMNKDSFYIKYLNRIQATFEKTEDASQYFFLASAKYNFNISFIFSHIFKKINQIDSLWIKVAYDEEKRKESETDELLKIQQQKKGFLQRLFNCCASRKDDATLEDEILKNEFANGKKKKRKRKVKDEYSDDEEYDKNEKINFDEEVSVTQLNKTRASMNKSQVNGSEENNITKIKETGNDNKKNNKSVDLNLEVEEKGGGCNIY